MRNSSKFQRLPAEDHAEYVAQLMPHADIRAGEDAWMCSGSASVDAGAFLLACSRWCSGIPGEDIRPLFRAIRLCLIGAEVRESETVARSQV